MRIQVEIILLSGNLHFCIYIEIFVIDIEIQIIFDLDISTSLSRPANAVINAEVRNSVELGVERERNVNAEANVRAYQVAGKRMVLDR